MMKNLFAVVLIAALLMGCAGMGLQVEGAKDPAKPGAELTSMGLELLAFNGGYLLADKYPAKFAEVMQEVALLEGVLKGDSVEAANAAFRIGVQKLLEMTDNDPYVRANVTFISKKIKFVSTGQGTQPLIDIPQMAAIVQNFKDGAEQRAMFGY